MHHPIKYLISTITIFLLCFCVSLKADEDDEGLTANKVNLKKITGRDDDVPAYMTATWFTLAFQILGTWVVVMNRQKWNGPKVPVHGMGLNLL